MQTAVEYIFEQLEENSLFFRGTENELNISISASDYLDIKRLAKEMEKQQIIDAYGDGLNAHRTDFCNRDEYFAKTYGSKGSDECQFEPTTNTSSATICKHCGKEKFLHQ